MRSEVRDFVIPEARRVELRRFDNTWYRPGSRVRRILWYLSSLAFIDSPIPWPAVVKTLLLKGFGARIGEGVVVKPRVRIKYPWFLNLGNHVWIGEEVWIDNLAVVTIGDNVCISQGAYILTGNHDYSSSAFDLKVSPVTIEDGVWIGAKATLCPGTVAGSHCVVTVGSVLSGNSEPWTIYRGNPAEPIRRREITE